MSFLRAEWRKLVMANYVIDPKLLIKYVPCGTELDFWEERCYVSLVGFMFLNTRLLGVKVPFHTNFEEVNLRFYVKRRVDEESKRGVVFIKELVPKQALAWIANFMYKEHYESLPMNHKWVINKETHEIEYGWNKNSDWHRINVQASSKSKEIQKGSETEFIAEHYWGYSKVDQGKSNEYEVIHPTWKVYDVLEYKIEVDFGSLYGNEFAFLNNQEPHSVFLAEGSDIKVESKVTFRC